VKAKVASDVFFFSSNVPTMRTEKQTEQERNAGKLESTKTKQPNDKKRERRRFRMGQ
jgi:hypothetical protein